MQVTKESQKMHQPGWCHISAPPLPSGELHLDVCVNGYLNSTCVKHALSVVHSLRFSIHFSSRM